MIIYFINSIKVAQLSSLIYISLNAYHGYGL